MESQENLEIRINEETKKILKVSQKTRKKVKAFLNESILLSEAF
jgi:hypothetical protein